VDEFYKEIQEYRRRVPTLASAESCGIRDVLYREPGQLAGSTNTAFAKGFLVRLVDHLAHGLGHGHSSALRQLR